MLHLEQEIPSVERVTVDGLVSAPRSYSLQQLQRLAPERAVVPLHCVWGWSRPTATWDGVPLKRILDASRARGDFVVVHSASGAYSSCLPIADAMRGMLAWGRDGDPLPPEAGGPLRFVAPAEYWGYKSIKWVSRVAVVAHFSPGLWESKVADPIGRIPPGLEVG